VRVEIHSPVDQTLIEILERAYRVSYDEQVNAAPMGSFMLPRDDSKWSSIVPFREAWIFNDLDELIDLFRIAPVQERREDEGTTAMVKLEGYGCVLQDDLIYDEQIYTNQSVTNILTALLAFQSVARVSLGTVDASLDKVITIRAANVNVMRACWEVRNVVGGFISVDPVGGNPAQRKLNLRADPGQDIGQRIVRGFNLRGMAKTTETQPVVTKLYPLGRGEGRPQIRPSADKLTAQPATLANAGVVGQRATLTITDLYSRYKGWTAAGNALPDGIDAKDTRSRALNVLFGATDDTANWEQGVNERQLRSKVNNYTPPAGAPTLDYVHAEYLIADDTVGTYGTIGGTLVDKSHETSDALVRAARVYLETAKLPRVSHEIRVHDLARIYTTESFERLHLYDKVNVWDPELGITTKDRIVALKYGDMQDPESFEVTVANVELAALTSRSVSVADRVRKYEGQPDGATTLYGPDSFEDNLTATFPYSRNIEIPLEALSVLSLKLRMRVKPYRMYESTATAAAGGGTTVTSGASSSSTSGTDATTSTQYNTTEGAHQHTQTDTAAPSASTTSVAPGSTDSATPTSGNQLTLHVHSPSTVSHDHSATVPADIVGSTASTGTESTNHAHQVTHSHTFATTHNHSVTVSHNHSMTGQAADGAHTHPHTHSINHSHTIAHTHSVTLTDHIHTITVNPGINETTTPGAMQVKVDGNVASAAATVLDDFDITPYLTRNGDGTIQKGLHTITFTPDVNGRVQATIKGLLFLQSRGAIVG
jgi:hypothetical protein